MAYQPPQLHGRSPAFLATLDQASACAALDASALIIGESGTGKSAFARRVHFLSPRWEGPFERHDCALDPDPNFIELEDYSGGTYCFEGIDHLSASSQARLLDILETPPEPEGHTRIIATSKADLPALAKAGTFSADLMNALALDVITLPPLRVRGEDAILLAERFGAAAAAEFSDATFPGFSADVTERLLTRPWPGNIRQLKAVIRRAVAQAVSLNPDLSDLITDLAETPFASPFTAQPVEDTSNTAPTTQTEISDESPLPQAFNERVLRYERALIDEAMTIADHHQGKASEHLDLTYHQFRGLLRKHGLKK